MEHLPDDVLLMLMSHLDLPDLLQFRLVCKRLAPLALHRDVWRHRHVVQDHLRHRVFCAALRLAPCVYSLGIEFPSSFKAAMLFTAPCAARKLTLTVLGDGREARQASQLIRHQSSLGRLREIDLDIYYIYGIEYDTATAALFKTLASTSGLDALKITDNLFPLVELGAPAPPSTIAASLTRFECVTSVLRCRERFINAVLTTHAATLTDVRIVSIIEPWQQLSSPSTAPALASIPHLAKLECPMLPGMKALAACAALRTVKLVVHRDMAAALWESTAAFFQLAHQLRHVSIQCQELSDASELVSAMASSGRSCVETVCVDNQNLPDRPQAERLVADLPLLPALRQLKVNVGAHSDTRRTLLAAANNSLRVDLVRVTAYSR